MLGASLLLVGVGAVLLSTGFDRDPKLEVVGQERPVNISARSTTDISAHNSPTLARNPTRPANLAVSSRIDTPVFDCALHVSLDGGGTWRQTSIPAPKGGGKCYNPDVAFSADGTLYVSFVMLKGRGNVPASLWMSTSQDGGRTLSEPVRVHGPLTFQVRVAADTVDPERVYLTFLQASEVGTLKFTETGNPIQIMRSDDGGATWDAPVRVSSAARERVIAPAPVVGRDGTLYVLYSDLGDDRLNYEGGHQGTGGEPYPGPTSLVLSRSTDGGESWVESVAADDLVPIQRFVVFLAQFPSVAVDGDGRVFAAFHSATLGDPDVWLWSLERGASSWSGPVRVNDTRRRDGTAQYLPKLSAAPDGRLDVLYYDRRADPENLRNHVSLQSSFDHGETFTESVRLTSRPSDSRIGFGAKEGLPDLGSRLGLLSTDRAALGLWTDTRAGVPETQKQDLAEGAVAVTPPEELSAGVETTLRFGGIALCLAGLALLALGFRRRGTATPA
ncbi:MAG: sialidase family protein [Thermoleophilia bacterium]